MSSSNLGKTVSELRNHPGLPWVSLALMLLVTAVQLRMQGRLWIAASGKILPWVSDTFSAENSQHVLDPYSFSHLQHGLFFFFLLLPLFPRLTWSWRFFLSATLEAGWEVLENSAFIIERYRNETAAFGYTGDSILNSMSDVACCSAGFALAYLLGAKRTLVLFFLIEAAMIASIKDSLLLNVIMLIHPFQAIKDWQLGV
jgi:hypothetical protein